MDNEFSGAALTAFENTASKKMQSILQNLRDRAVEASSSDRALVDSLRASGKGLRIETIPPPTASIIVLTHNQFNRNISLGKVDQMIEDLKARDWRMHHQGIAFTRDGDLADGQHRLVACGVSGVPMTTVVAADFDMAAIDAIDRSTRRTLVQVMQMRGETDAAAKVSVGRVVVPIKYRIDHGVNQKPNFSEHRMGHELKRIDSFLSQGIEYGKASTRNVSNPTLDWRDAAAVATILLMAHWEPALVTKYLVAVQEGIAPYDNAPTLALVKTLAKGRENKDRLDTTSRIAYSLKAAVHFAKNQRVAKLKWIEKEEGIPNPEVEEIQEAA